MGALDDLDELRTFALVVEAGNFSAAARILQVTTNAVSRRVIRLEQNLGLKLLNRSTRAVVATAEGRILYARVRRILDDLDLARGELAAGSQSLTGSLRVAIPGGACSPGVLRGLASLLHAHPEFKLQVRVVNGPVDPISGGFDIALHVGPMKDSALIARRLARVRWALAASPSYAAHNGLPQNVAELASHTCLRLAGDYPQDLWMLEDDQGREFSVPVFGQFEADDSRVLGDATYAGIGIGLRPQREIAAAVAAGTLVAVLPEYRFAALDIHALLPSGLSRLPRVSRFLELLGGVLQEDA
jgi:DNA-binding transcriptional LysR family regulator